MEKFEIYENEHEQDRLDIQDSMLREYELPVYEKVMSGHKGLRILDIGCNDGVKTADIFSRFDIERLIGVECSEKMAELAQKCYGSDRFSFFCADAEAEGFEKRLSDIMVGSGIEEFDVINLSYVLMHLKNPQRVLEILRSVLAEDGRIIVEEANDALAGITNDSEKLFDGFVRALSTDPLAGNRNFCRELRDIAAKAGCKELEWTPCRIAADAERPEYKRVLFDVFYSYLPEDIALLRRQEPDNADYARAEDWLRDNYERLYALAMSENTEMSVGIILLVCGK